MGPILIPVVENHTYFRDLNPDIVTLSQHLLAHGYETVYCGKLFHGQFTDDALSWSRTPARNRVTVKRSALPGGYALPENQAIFKRNKAAMVAQYGAAATCGLGMGPATECADVPDQTCIDGYNTDLAIATLRDRVEKGDKPFFLGLGFKLPHLNGLFPCTSGAVWTIEPIRLRRTSPSLPGKKKARSRADDGILRQAPSSHTGPDSRQCAS